MRHVVILFLFSSSTYYFILLVIDMSLISLLKLHLFVTVINKIYKYYYHVLSKPCPNREMNICLVLNICTTEIINLNKTGKGTNNKSKSEKSFIFSFNKQSREFYITACQRYLI